MSTQDSVTHNNTTCRSRKELSTTCSFKKRPICNCAVAVSLSSHCRRSFDFCFESNSKFLSTILRLSFVKHSQNFLFPKTTNKKKKNGARFRVGEEIPYDYGQAFPRSQSQILQVLFPISISPNFNSFDS